MSALLDDVVGVVGDIGVGTVDPDTDPNAGGSPGCRGNGMAKLVLG